MSRREARGQGVSGDAPGGEPSDAATLCRHAGQDRGATIASRAGEPLVGAGFSDQGGRARKVTELRVEEGEISGFRILRRSQRGPFRGRGSTRPAKPNGQLHSLAARRMLAVVWESKLLPGGCSINLELPTQMHSGDSRR